MVPMKYSTAIEIRRGSRGEDRAYIFFNTTGFVAIVADGAGGMGGGADAATAVCDLAHKVAFASGDAWSQFLREADVELSRAGTGGQTTAVVVQVSDGSLFGASVGDSGAMLLK